jgi:hypothetical protein
VDGTLDLCLSCCLPSDSLWALKHHGNLCRSMAEPTCRRVTPMERDIDHIGANGAITGARRFELCVNR